VQQCACPFILLSLTHTQPRRAPPESAEYDDALAMPLTYRIDPAQRIVIITGDYAEPAEWRTLLGALATDPGYRHGFSFIRDLRSSEHPVSAEAVVGIIAVVRAYWPKLGAHRAAIVTRPGVDMPAVMAEALADDEDIPLRAFTSYADALDWVREE
jgi:hypothetical protein